MPNMSYCRFENTYNDLIDCLDNINDEAGNERDERYRIRLIKLIADNMDLINDLKDIEPEYQQSQFTMYIHGINNYNMSKLTFTDGETFDLSGPLRLEERYDGWYVLGNNKMIPVSSQDAGRRLIDDELAKVYSIIDIINN